MKAFLSLSATAGNHHKQMTVLVSSAEYRKWEIVSSAKEADIICYHSLTCVKLHDLVNHMRDGKKIYIHREGIDTTSTLCSNTEILNWLKDEVSVGV